MSDTIDGLNHPIDRWTFASAALRAAAGNYFAQDIGKLAFQSDTGTYWRFTGLVAGLPIWIPAGLVLGASYQGGVTATPTGTTSLTQVMLGYAGSITPISSGRILIYGGGGLFNNTGVNVNGCLAQLRYGTGTAPINGAAVTGTAIGPITESNLKGANEISGFGLMGIVTGLVLGTAYWLDFGFAAMVAGTGSLRNIAIAANEF